MRFWFTMTELVLHPAHSKECNAHIYQQHSFCAPVSAFHETDQTVLLKQIPSAATHNKKWNLRSIQSIQQYFCSSLYYGSRWLGTNSQKCWKPTNWFEGNRYSAGSKLLLSPCSPSVSLCNYPIDWPVLIAGLIIAGFSQSLLLATEF